MSKHTPEPWLRNSFTGESSQEYSISEVYAETPDGPVSVARVARTTTAEGTANWRLIQAAPALLHALQRIATELNDESEMRRVARHALGFTA